MKNELTQLGGGKILIPPEEDFKLSYAYKVTNNNYSQAYFSTIIKKIVCDKYLKESVELIRKEHDPTTEGIILKSNDCRYSIPVNLIKKDLMKNSYPPNI